jgi:D-arginine dehydrogenase
MAGVSIGFELASHGSVVVVEREPMLAAHTTGRSAAAFIESYGGPVVRALTRASRASFDSAPELLGTPQLLTPRPFLWVGSRNQADVVRRFVESVGPGQVELLDVDQAFSLCPALSPDYLGAAAVDHAAMDIDVMALHQGYVGGLARRGASVLRGAPLRSLEKSGQTWKLVAGDEELEATAVVNAAGAWADQVAVMGGLPPLGLRPLRRTIAICTGTRSDDISAWPLVADVSEQFYFKPESGQHVLVSPADETPTQPADVRPIDEDIALAIDRVNEATTLQLRHVRTAWAGLRTFAPDRGPVVGYDPEGEGFFWFAGQGGYGIQMAPALARVGAYLATETPLADDLLRHGVSAQAVGVARLRRIH